MTVNWISGFLTLAVITTLSTYGRLALLLLPCADAATTVYDLTDYEQETLDEFRSNVIHLVHKDFMKTDAYLLRWLIVADFDLQEAVQRLTKSLAWRKEKNVDSILSENYTFIDNAYPAVLDGTDKDGRPVVYAQIGRFDFRQIVISGHERIYQRYNIRILELFEEYMHYWRETTGFQNMTQITGIYDISGFNLKQGGCYQCLKMVPEAFLNFEENYPGVFYRLYFINCPAIFYNVFSVSRNFMSEKTKQALQVFDYDKAKWSATILDQIPSDQLAVKYGGQRIIPQDRSSFAKNPLLKAIWSRVRSGQTHNPDTTESQPLEKTEPYGYGKAQASFGNSVQDVQSDRENQDRIPMQAQHKEFGTTAANIHFTRQKHHHHFRKHAEGHDVGIDSKPKTLRYGHSEGVSIRISSSSLPGLLTCAIFVIYNFGS